MKKTLVLGLLALGAVNAHAGWWDGHASYYTNEGTIAAVSTADGGVSATNTYGLMAGDVATATITNLTIAEGHTASVQYNNGNSKDITLTVTNLTVENGGLISVGAGQNLTITNATGLTSAVVNGALTTTGNYTTLKDITFGESGQIGGKFNVGQTESSFAITLSNAAAVDAVVSSGTFYTQTLISGEIWNAEYIASATTTVLGGNYADGGFIYYNATTDRYYANAQFSSASGWSFSNELVLAPHTAYTVGNVTSQYSLTSISALVTPEPATATLSLLALVGLAARRRRH